MNVIVPAALAGERVDRVVAMLTGLTRAESAALVAAGGVQLAGRTVTTRSRKVAEGDELVVAVPDASTDKGPEPDPAVVFTVVHADDDVVVVDKPADLVVHPGSGNERGTLVQGLLARYPEIASVGEQDRPGIVHRLDKGTSGLLVVARSQRAYDALVAQLSGRTAKREYIALVWDRVAADAGLIDAPLGRGEHDPTRMAVSHQGREARTRYQVTRRFGTPAPATLLDCSLETGRTHQIRVHLQAIGHPVVGDDRYGGSRPAVLTLDRPFLHAARLSFDHPGTGERLSFAGELPADLTAVLAQFT